MKRKVVIYGQNLERAIDKMNECYNKDELIIKRTKDTVETENKIYKAVVAKQSNRALKYHDAYIDLEISLRLYFDTIRYQKIINESIDDKDGFCLFY